MRARLFWLAVALASSAVVYLTGPWIAASLSQLVGIVVGSISVEGIFRSQAAAELIPRNVSIDLGPVGSSGNRSYAHIAKLVVRNATSVIVKPRLDVLKISGNLDVVGGATLILTSLGGDGTVYRIPMPCSISTGACYRPMVVIPGYDEPLAIRAGEYSVSLHISWQTVGQGETRIAVKLDIVEAQQQRD